jgi:hypothetical protein
MLFHVAVRQTVATLTPYTAQEADVVIRKICQEECRATEVVAQGELEGIKERQCSGLLVESAHVAGKVSALVRRSFGNSSRSTQMPNRCHTCLHRKYGIYVEVVPLVIANDWKIEPSRTNQILQSSLEFRRPRLWIFGHHHQTKTVELGCTTFNRLGELQTFRLEYTR